ncbi:hypothetical protein DFA_01704 [Cavenderia fasciculata]|uniref:Uncharacterized protein n=1 Tax=Cavenderia fasciculata TaxID=261658 RepID=F4PUA3_CACFS|nr:uncharacterized protein DFA_01704 [Cavenderia fasciculata]EGG21818.1 hypothetical protein DFA_01704 [Cavenderia fasciculata]|eukprot:XP_004359668.1 hypothetical protein DFA_01704 [Cavenderia fasciculata]
MDNNNNNNTSSSSSSSTTYDDDDEYNNNNNNSNNDDDDLLKPPSDGEGSVPPQGPVSFLVDVVSDFLGVGPLHNDNHGVGLDSTVNDHSSNIITSPGEALDSVINNESTKEIQLPWGPVSVKRVNEVIFLLGGASIISFALRTLFFGKTVRAIEIPDGNLTTIILRSNTIKSLKKSILQNSDPLFPGVSLTADDIKTSAFVDPIFTEPILTNNHVRQIQDGAYIVWTKADYEIPRTSVALKSLIKDRPVFDRLRLQSEMDKIIKLISLLGPSLTDKQIELHHFRRVTAPSLWHRIKRWWNNRSNVHTQQYHPDMPINYQEIVMNDHTNPLTLRERDELIHLMLIGKGDPIFDLYRKHQYNIIEFKKQLKSWIHQYNTNNKQQ